MDSLSSSNDEEIFLSGVNVCPNLEGDKRISIKTKRYCDEANLLLKPNKITKTLEDVNSNVSKKHKPVETFDMRSSATSFSKQSLQFILGPLKNTVGKNSSAIANDCSTSVIYTNQSSKSLWDIDVIEYNQGINKLFNNLKIDNDHMSINAEDMNKISLHFQTTPLNVGFVIDEIEINKFVNSLPVQLRNDYNQFKEQYTIVDYRFFNKIFKTLHGIIDNVDFTISNNLPLYFNFKKNPVNDKIPISLTKLIDVKISYDLLTNGIYGIKQNFGSYDQNIIIINKGKNLNCLPTYPDNSGVPIIIWTYLHIMRTFILKYFNRILNDNDYIMCPINILCVLYEYSKMVTYIAYNCRQNVIVDS